MHVSRGKICRKLEGQFARNFNSKFCISANSATSCLSMAVGALDLGPGDEVLLPSDELDINSYLYFDFPSNPNIL